CEDRSASVPAIVAALSVVGPQASQNVVPGKCAVLDGDVAGIVEDCAAETGAAAAVRGVAITGEGATFSRSTDAEEPLDARATTSAEATVAAITAGGAAGAAGEERR